MNLNTQQPNHLSLPLSWQSLLLAVVVGFGVLTTVGLTVISWLTPSVLLIQVNDKSASAVGFASVRETLCQTSAQLLKHDDTVVWLAFSDRAEVTRELKLKNSIELLGLCRQVNQVITSSAPGTSFMRAVDRTVQAITHQRTQNNKNPIAVIFTLQAAEPGPGQPKLDWVHIRQQIERITQDRSMVTIIGPTGKLQSDLATHLTLPRVHICPIASAQTCLESTVQTARSL